MINFLFVEYQLNNKIVNTINSRELYSELGLGKGQYSRWIKLNLYENPYFVESIDFIKVRHDVEGNVVDTAFVTINTAKHLAMVSRSQKSYQIRQYFIEVENKYKLLENPKESLISVSTDNMRKEVELLEFAFKNFKMSENEKRVLTNKVFEKLNFPTLEIQPKRKAELVFTLTKLLEDFQISFSPHEINLKFQSFGILQRVGGYWFLENLKFGVNENYENYKNPKYYKSTFQELLDIVL